MRFFIAALEHETNTFSPISTDMSSYENMILYRPSSGGHIGAYDRVADFADLASKGRHDMVRSVSALAQPSGPTQCEVYESLRDEILQDLRDSLPVDAVMLVLHGAQMAFGYDDCEGDLIQAVREIVGPNMPVAVQLDLHANLTEQMLEHATFLVACKEYPHTDYKVRAAEMIKLCEHYSIGSIRPVHSVYRVPMLCLFRTNESPMRELVDDTIELERRDEILSTSLIHGFPWSDMDESGSAVLVTTDNAREIGATLAKEIGHRFFGMRTLFNNSYETMSKALDRAKRCKGGTLIIADIADNAGGGAGGDSTHLVRELLRRGISNAAVAMIYDPDSVEAARNAGVGAKLNLKIGGKISELSGKPLEVDATVIAVNDDAAQQGLGPQLEPLGRSAAVSVNGVDIVLNSRRQQTFSPDCFTELGIDPSSKRVLVVKSFHHFYNLFKDITTDISYCDASGTVSPRLHGLPFKKLRRPMWPLDKVELDDS